MSTTIPGPDDGDDVLDADDAAHEVSSASTVDAPDEERTVDFVDPDEPGEPVDAESDPELEGRGPAEEVG
ncbi:hypothetical protein ACFJGV_08280 [Cnuibacter sp. UC19_7]|uniref:hypothetical protein n=1 Tax=Cnuibacter sp. UC19_7 TaxID=3350166 RepID=UPI0036709622